MGAVTTSTTTSTPTSTPISSPTGTSVTATGTAPAGTAAGDRLVRRLRAVHSEVGDAELVAGTLAGDVEAFGELYRRHHRGVRAAVSDWTRDPQRQHELVQDSFLRAMQQLGRLRDRDRFRPWLLQIARHTAIDDARRRSRRPIESLELVPEPVSDEEPWSAVEAGLLADRIARSVAELPPREATALSLTVAEGYDQVALGEALGITPGHARVVLHRARRHLRDALERPARRPLLAG